MSHPVFGLQVLSTEDVKVQLRRIKQAVLFGGEVVHFGDRQRDELVIASRERFDQLLEAERQLAAQQGPPRASPQAGLMSGLKAALVSGQLTAAAPAARRHQPGAARAEAAAGERNAQAAAVLVQAPATDRAPTYRRRVPAEAAPMARTGAAALSQ